MKKDAASPQVESETRRQQIAANLRRLFSDGQTFEIRCLGKRPLSGFFDDIEAAAANALVAESEGYACYFGLSPRDPKKRNPTNGLKTGKAGNESDVLCRRWLLIDADPKRPAGVCSTEIEKAEAKKVIKQAILWLCREQGWPQPILADSGNGHHALFRIDLPTADEGLVENCLNVLASKFDTDTAKIDISVHDAPRICRLYGTKNCKGDNTPERPHRISSILGVGGEQPVPKDKLAAVATLAKQAQKTAKPNVTNVVPLARPATAEALAEQLNAESLDGPLVTPETIINWATEWIANETGAVEGEHGDEKTRDTIWNLVAGFCLSEAEAWPLLEAYNLRCTPPWKEADLQAKLNNALLAAEKKCEKPGYLARKRHREESKSSETERGSTQTEMLVDLIKANATLWHSPDHEPFATVSIKGHLANMEIGASTFARWMEHKFFDTHGTIPRKMARDAAIDMARGLALFEGEMHPVHLRLAGHDERLYVDLGSETWEAVEIDATGWRIIKNPPVKFHRVAGTLPFPTPVPGGSIAELRPFVNVATDDDFILVTAWVVMCFHQCGEYPIQVLGGQQGTSKSTTQRVFRALIDPNTADLRSTPRKEDDFAVEAANNRLLCFDNLSYIDDWLSDALCRLSSGGANAKRRLYSDSEQVLVRYCGPAVINGVVTLARRPDLLDRSILIDLPVIANRQTKRAFWQAFEQARPRILGAILDALVYALANPVTVENPPRMAEFADWASAAEPALADQWNKATSEIRERSQTEAKKYRRAAALARELVAKAADEATAANYERRAMLAEQRAEDLEVKTPIQWTPGCFMAVYRANIRKAALLGLDNNPISQHIVDFAERHAPWKGSASDLLERLRVVAKEAAFREGWPKNAVALGMALQRLAPSLAMVGVIVSKSKDTGGNRDRWWSIEFRQ